MKAAVCGARKPFEAGSLALAWVLGKELALSGFVVVTGATLGVSLEAARGAKAVGGKVFGVSPAATKSEHVEKFGYPVDEFDEIDFSGRGVLGRNILIVERSDVVLFVDGGVGTLNEFSIALQLKKPIGVLEGQMGVAGNAKTLLEIVGLADFGQFFSESDPKKLVEKIFGAIKK
ncbi:MAG: hypothetical protein AABW85_04360 [archaeon]